MERFAKTVNGLKVLTVFPISSILYVWQGSEYASAKAKECIRIYLIKIKKRFLSYLQRLIFFKPFTWN